MVQYALKMTHDDEVGLPPHYAPTGKMPKPLTDADSEDHCLGMLAPRQSSVSRQIKKEVLTTRMDVEDAARTR